MDITSYLLGKKSGGGGITPTGTINITENGETDVTSYATANVNVTPDLESKSVTITENTTTTITPTSGKDGLSSVEVVTNVAGSSYAPRYLRFQNYTGANLDDEIAGLDTSNLTTMENMFYYCTDLNITTADFSGWNTTNVTSMNSMFAECSKITSIDLSTWDNQGCVNTTRGLYNMFGGDTALTSIDIRNFKVCDGGNGTNSMFYNCKGLQHLDIRGMKFTNSQRYSSQAPTDFLKNVPTTCEIIVKDATEKAWWASYFPSYTNVKTVAEYEV